MKHSHADAQNKGRLPGYPEGMLRVICRACRLVFPIGSEVRRTCPECGSDVIVNRIFNEELSRAQRATRVRQSKRDAQEAA